MTARNSSAFLFDDIRVEPTTFRAFKAEQVIQLEPKTLSLLLFLIENRGRLIEKEEILDAVWSGTHVTENALTREIGKLRKSLGDDPKAPKYIETVHTRGYRFIAELAETNGSGTAVSPKAETVEAETPAESLGGPAPVLATAPVALKVTPAKRTHLYRVIAAVLATAIGLGVIGGIVLWKRRTAAVPSPTPVAGNSVAVLPFKTSVAGDEYLGFELADSLVNRLSNSTKLSVSPITDTLRYENQDSRTIGSLMKVDYVLSGEIDRPRQRMSINLIRVRDGVALLAESYDEKFDDIFKVEDSLGAKVLNSLMVTLDHEETQGPQRRYTENQRAYEAFLKAHFFMNKLNAEGIEQSIEYFRQAIALDPKYAMAYAGLSDTYMRLDRAGKAPAEYVPKSRAAVMKALELDETVAYAHSMLGRIAFRYDWDFPRAEREYARARELNPKLVHAWYGSYLLTMNRVAEAEAEQRKFEAFLPFAVGSILSQHFYYTGEYDRALDLINRKLETRPDAAGLHEWLGLILLEQKGRTGEAVEEFQKAINLSEGIDGLGALGHAFAVSGKLGDAENTLRRLDELSKQKYVSPFQKAVIYAGLGKKDEALKSLEKAYSERSLSPLSLRWDPRLNGLRGDPRFQDFMRRTGLLQ